MLASLARVLTGRCQIRLTAVVSPVQIFALRICVRTGNRGIRLTAAATTSLLRLKYPFQSNAIRNFIANLIKALKVGYASVPKKSATIAHRVFLYATKISALDHR